MISLIIPVFNAEKSLRKMWMSVKSQTFSDFEVLLVDDGSSDASADICDEITREDNRVRCLHKKNGGVSSARNAGLDAAKGEYVTFIDSDDYIAPDFLQRLAADANADLTICGFQSNEGIDYTPDTAHHEGEGFKKIIPELVSHPLMLYAPWAKLFRRSLIERHRLRFDERMRLFEDTIFVLTFLSYCNSVGTVSSNGYNYIGTWGGMRKYVLSREEVEYRCMVEASVLDRLEEKCGNAIERSERCYCIEYLDDLYSSFTDKDCCNLYLRYHPSVSAGEFFKSAFLNPTYAGISRLKRLYKTGNTKKAEKLMTDLMGFISFPADKYAYERKDERLIHDLLFKRRNKTAALFLSVYSFIKRIRT